MNEVKEKKKIGLTTKIFIALIAGAIVGIALNMFAADVDFVQNVLVNGIFYVVGQTGTVDDDIRMVNIGKTTDNGYILDRYITVAGYQLICCVAAETMTKCGTQSAACSRDPNAGRNTVHKTPLLSARCSGTAPARITHFMGCIFSIAQNC